MTEQSSLLQPPETENAALVVQRIAIIAVLAVLLGFTMQGLILGAKLLAGGAFPGAKLFVDLTQGVAWSVLICAGVGIGTAIMKVRAALAGLIAALFAPIALSVAKSVQKVMASAIGVVDQPAALSLVTISALRAVEYGILGWALASLLQKEVKSASAFLGAGCTVGVVFGGAIAALGYHAASLGGQIPGSAQVAASLVNEIVSPIGCALVIYCGQLVGRNVSMLSSHSPS